MVSSEMEDAANILGAGTWRTMVTVMLPLVWPAILAGIIIVFLETMALFGTPAIIGIPARINVVTTQLWQFFEFPTRVEVAAAYAIPLLLITVSLIWVQKLVLSRKGFVSQTRSEEHTSALQSLTRTSYPVFCVKQKNNTK